ncbi:tRNA-splicing endonuclease subunit Sen34 [Caerostris darwini]|uniref:tRNA-splicing endonuclease subunit Sen34 n=1 Tax=Caerostris darwini TaxID=1538125 RepID=A0AAV4MUN7_9ARAC|nr:tRNA-splicing endonuclease subunit Sen34 [Caerostris darwini]
MIKLYFCNKHTFVWNPEDACTLRKKYHIVGSLVGRYPIKPFQTQNKWLPFQLMPEETKLLIDKDIAQLVSIPKETTDTLFIELFHSHRNKLCEEQISLLKENRRQQILEKADQIYEGKKRKYLENFKKRKKNHEISDISKEEKASQSKTSFVEEKSNSEKNSCSIKIELENNLEKDCEKIGNKDASETIENSCDSEPINIDKNAIIEAELAKITGVSKEFCRVQLFTECPWKQETLPVILNYPSTEREKIRCAVYKDLWEKDYYITAGSKFGGDFLAYQGDPLKYHALFIVVCMCEEQTLQGYDLVVYGRLGHQVKKTVILASLDEEGQVDYVTLDWEGEMT